MTEVWPAKAAQPSTYCNLNHRSKKAARMPIAKIEPARTAVVRALVDFEFTADPPASCAAGRYLVLPKKRAAAAVAAGLAEYFDADRMHAQRAAELPAAIQQRMASRGSPK